MSWNVYILKFDGTPALEAMDADDFQPLPLGTSEAMRAKISSAFPNVDWSDPAWGSLDESGYSIEFPMRDGELDGLTLIVRGGGCPIPAIARLCHQNGWSAVADGELMNFGQPSSVSWDEWQSYRDQVIGREKR